VFDLADNRVVSRVTAHSAVALSVAWWSDTVLTSGSDGSLRQWSLTRDGLQRQDQAQEAGPVHMVKAFADGWAYGVNSTLVIGRAGRAPVRLELATPAKLSAYEQRAFDQGLGRCLWFVVGGDPGSTTFGPPGW